MQSQSYSQLLLEKGKKFYFLGEVLIKILIASVIILILSIPISLLSGGHAYSGMIFDVAGHEYAIPFMVAAYLGLVVGSAGPVLYFSGLHLLGLGQIAKNTEEK